MGEDLGAHGRSLTSHIPPQPCNYSHLPEQNSTTGCAPGRRGSVWGGVSWKSWLSQPVEQTMASPSGSLPLMTSPGKQQLKTRRPQRDTDIECGGTRPGSLRKESFWTLPPGRCRLPRKPLVRPPLGSPSLKLPSSNTSPSVWGFSEAAGRGPHSPNSFPMGGVREPQSGSLEL